MLFIVFPAAILQGRFFLIDRPNYVSYAIIGSLVGHEITHAMDDQGRQYDFDENLIDWCDPHTKMDFLKKKSKMYIINQYSNYLDHHTNLTVRLDARSFQH